MMMIEIVTVRFVMMMMKMVGMVIRLWTQFRFMLISVLMAL